MTSPCHPALAGGADLFAALYAAHRQLRSAWSAARGDPGPRNDTPLAEACTACAEACTLMLSTMRMPA